MRDQLSTICQSCGLPEEAGHVLGCVNNQLVAEGVESADEELVARSSFLEWCTMNSVANPDQFFKYNASAAEKVEMYGAVFREGAQKLMTELKDAKDDNAKFVDKLVLPKLKSELDVLRQKGDMIALGQKEYEIVQLFQQAISEYSYEQTTCHVDDILDRKEMNCVGASVLGSKLLDEVGIQYVVGEPGAHLMLIVITSDNRVFWQDMQDGKEVPRLDNEELIVRENIGRTEDGEYVTPRDIISFARQSTNKGLAFSLSKKGWENKPMTIVSPQAGLELNVLINTGFIFGNIGKNKEAIEILQVAWQKAPANTDVLFGLARAYKELGQYPEATEICAKAFKIDPADEHFKKLMDEISIEGKR